MDDGSKDNSGSICDEYANKDKRFKVIHKENEGVAKARITAFEHSKGELITFVDADDYVSKEYVEKLSSPIIKDDVDLTACNHYDVNGERMKSSSKLVGQFNDPKDFLAHHYVYDAILGKEGMARMLWAKMFKREYVERGLNAGLGLWFGEDQVAVFDILYNIKCLEQIPDVMYFYIHREGQATKKYDISLWDSIIAMSQRCSKIDKNHVATQMIWRRTWSYIMKTAKQKMISANLSSRTYCQHLSYMRENEYIKNFFKSGQTILCTADSKILFSLLKYRQYHVFYYCVRCRIFLSGLKRNLWSR